jgi:hypothetical protein
MGRKCVVPGCKSGYKSEKNQLSVFFIPKAKLEEWQKRIPRNDRNLTEKDVVCEKHFMPEYVIREIKTPEYSVSTNLYKLINTKIVIITSTTIGCIYVLLHLIVNSNQNQSFTDVNTTKLSLIVLIKLLQKKEKKLNFR